MKIRHNIYLIGTTLALLTSCSSEDGVAPVYTVGEANNAIVLNAGLSDKKPVTRAYDENHTNTNGDITHKTFVPGTKLLLRVDGTWTGHQVNGVDAPLISQKTVATAGSEITLTGEDEATHNSINEYNPVLYWDDYGTADPANKGTGKGREAGLTIYGVAVNDKNATDFDEITKVTDWENIAWNVGEPTAGQIATQRTNGIFAKDLLTSNNIRSTTGGDGTLKFDDIFDGDDDTKPSNLLEFTHAMTKVRVELTAGVSFSTGFAAAGTAGAPEVTLQDFYYKGKVDVETKKSEPIKIDNEVPATADIDMHRFDDGTVVRNAYFEALVFPGRVLADNDVILSFSADGNNFDVTAKNICDKMPEADKTMLQATEYILKITVNKTDIDVEATIVEWTPVTAAPEEPKINITDTYGDTGTDFGKGFDFFLSANKKGSYLLSGSHSAVTFADSKYTMTDQLYWPNHSIHYFFRGTWPLLGTSDQTNINNAYIPSAKVRDTTEPVSTVIDIENVAYTEGTYPSDLMLAIPHSKDDECDNKHERDECSAHNKNVETYGICATEGKIRMNFHYMMSQVEVELRSVTGNGAVNIDENTVVEIVNVYNTGTVKMEDGSITTSGAPDNYTLAKVSGEAYKMFRKSAIVPQMLTYSEPGAETNMRFKITVTNNDAVYYTAEDAEVISEEKQVGDIKFPATTDVYYADIQPIKKQGTEDLVAPDSEWESGMHYKYVLTLSKTKINVTATLTDWQTVYAEGNIWF